LKTSQDLLILEHLKRGPITPLEALSLYGCFRLAARVNDLRKKGIHIETEDVEENGKRYARYFIPRPVQLGLAI
jgi:hypothetical protein